MRILYYSDLHLEFGHGWVLPAGLSGDLLVLAGDVINFTSPAVLKDFLQYWHGPVLYIPGNHEYYDCENMGTAITTFRTWAAEHIPNLTLLNDEFIDIAGVSFFGGTMWTDFQSLSAKAEAHAQSAIGDFRWIQTRSGMPLQLDSWRAMHDEFVSALEHWLTRPFCGRKVVITHHAPLQHTDIFDLDSPLLPGYCAIDVLGKSRVPTPDVWIFGHTRRCLDLRHGQTRYLSNQRGYTNGLGGYDCKEFDPRGGSLDL